MPIGRVCINRKTKKVKRKPSDKFKLPRAASETLAFKNFNFKVAVMNELMYEKSLLQPKFDVFEYCEERESIRMRASAPCRKPKSGLRTTRSLQIWQSR